MIIQQSLQIRETETGRTRLRYEMATGFSLVTQPAKSSVLAVLPLDIESMDALVAAWPAFKAECQSDAPAKYVAPVTGSPGVFRDGPGHISSPSPSPPPRPSIASGTGAPSSGSERASGVDTSPSAPRTQLL